ncbi:fluoride efflux transporter CrcB [Cerasibacillus terrae]|uniref:Fluoride-specific ion channel FluC n=1 Tax=Cerasibacillus terrae TaxID=2498845 RepID=A0A5C8NWY3_9BACI|nr:fluoride efflux transporter CrcB [Cerasibacillus terrae]
MSLLHVVLVGIGGCFGAISRFFVSQFIKKKYSFRIPVATLIVNLLGSFLLGIIVSIGLNNKMILFLGTGYMGAFTTFSTLQLESIQLYLSERRWKFYVYNFITYGGGIILAFLGMVIGGGCFSFFSS